MTRTIMSERFLKSLIIDENIYSTHTQESDADLIAIHNCLRIYILNSK